VKRPKTPEAYAAWLYDVNFIPSQTTQDMSDTFKNSEIRQIRVRAFVDGVRWQQRRARRTPTQEAE
jgi:hypothetical protein